MIDPEAEVADSAAFGNYVVVLKGAFVGENAVVHGFTQIWPDVRLGVGTSLGSGVVLEQPSEVNHHGISFGENCQVGAGAVICQGVAIGEGAIVRPGSVVEQNVPPYAIASGVPAKVMGYVDNLEGGKVSTWNLQATFPNSPAVVPLAGC